ncbi:MAG: FRG domain-containing protein [Nitrospira sp.]|nr:FRG domain-containing protein [Nitrospira sp.]
MSKRWRKVHAKDLSGFMALVEEKWIEWSDVSGDDIEPWFRGHADASWGLVPGLYRSPFNRVDEDQYRHEFRLRAHPFLNEATYYPRSDWDFYFLMQHHGLPTRLLDWSESALISLYFAVQRSPLDSQSGAVWMLDPWQLNKHVAQIGDRLTAYDNHRIKQYLWPIWKKRDAHLPEGPAAFEPSHNSKRIAAQRGKFTIHGKSHRGLDTYRPLSTGLVKIVISPSAKQKIRRQLATAGMTEGTIFPDLSGLSREIKEGWSYEVE